ncbi:MAG: DUF4270 domain-containing protein [Clostridium sp.]|nr:DUF4270 domain-containing protein [Prevotella sp.]MCM1429628.1 DUF4270 domain-containing protein [Clostridium sp.]MCM1474688.1 DUF4270 domain-containing protein [Muribaculaceae bacterium]
MNKCSFHKITSWIVMTAGVLAVASCEDEVSTIGSGIRPADVTINVDSAQFNLHGHSIETPEIDSRSTSTLLGTIDTESYGRLECSFVTQLLPAQNVNIPDSIKPADIDSVKLIMRIPRGKFTGDSLTPQQVTVYRLTNQLPANISSTYNPEGNYDASPMGRQNYTLSALSMGSTANLSKSILNIQVPMPRDFGVDALKKYREDPEFFLWPAIFAKSFPGLYLKSTFGKGCVAALSSVGIYVYTHHKQSVAQVVDNKVETTIKTIKDSTIFFTSAPEVLSNNIISYRPSTTLRQLVADGNAIITTPGGFASTFIFPAEEVLEKYYKKTTDLGVINNLTMSIPGEKITNPLEIGVPQTLLMVKKSEAETFFSDSKVPDFKTSFLCIWDAQKGSYKVNNMRDYIIAMANMSKITDADKEFMLVPVNTQYQTVTNSDGTEKNICTSCVPYLSTPTMVRLRTERATIVFTYSNQTIE